MAKKKKRLILIDSNALIHRAFHALPPLTTKDGTPSGAVYGVTLTVLSVLERFKPDYVVATFDLKGPTFRHKKFKEYKAKRVKAPDELYQQIPLTKKLMEAFGIPIYEKKGFEADDVIGTISKDKKINGNIERIIVTGDMDALQLVDHNTKVFTLRKGIKDTFIYDEQQVENRFQLKPNQIVDYKALRGDPSDNIPGVKGIGEKGATDLLKKYKTLEGVYKNLDKIEPEGLKNKLREGEQDAFMSQDLAEIKTNLPINFNLEEAVINKVAGAEKLVKFLSDMGFKSLVRRVGGDTMNLKSNGSEVKAQQISKQLKIKTIENEKEMADLINKIRKEKKFGYIVLTNKDKFYGAKFEGMGVYIGGDVAYFVKNEYNHSLSGMFNDNKIEKIGFNVKFDLEVLITEGLIKNPLDPLFKKRETNWQDVEIVAYLLGHNAGNLEKLIMKEFGAELAYNNNKGKQGSLLVGTDELRQKNVAEQAFWVRQLWEGYFKKLKTSTNKLYKVYRELELPLLPILAQMEMTGVRVDKRNFKKISDLAREEIKELEEKIYKLAGEKFNVSSPSQLALILYEKLKISTGGIKRGKTGFSTDANQLRKIKKLHPIVALVEEYREYSKLKNTYADALPRLAEDDGRIHANFNQAVVATGRLSSSDPNLQNIPKRGRLASEIRKSFIAEKGKMLVSADYSQIDLRVAAHLSGDIKMIKIFKEGKDIHRATAAWVNNISEEEVTDKQRSEAKSLNFGILYGMGLYGFMRDSGVDMERAKFFINHYKKTFSDLTEFIEKTKAEAQKKGYVETEMGRRRYIPNIKASNAMLRGMAERMAVNLPVQGLAADIMKLAMIKVMSNRKLIQLKAKMILQIHDELIFEIKSELANEFMRELKKTMEAVYKLKVPLIVDVIKGKNWNEL